MSTYVMSDIHGQYQAYMDILNQIGFSNFEMEDHLYILGDVIDRGKRSLKILEHVMSHPDNITMLMGNHELMMVECLGDFKTFDPTGDETTLWLENGGDSTFLEFIDFYKKEEQRKFLSFLKALPYFKEIQVGGTPYYLVHASPYGCGEQWEETHNSGFSKEKMMLWAHFTHSEDKKTKVVFGHKPVVFYDKRWRHHRPSSEHLEIYMEDHFIAIDCGCATALPHCRLGCIRLEDLSTFYAVLSPEDLWDDEFEDEDES